MGCKFSKTNKVLPVVEPTRVKPAASPATSPKAKAKKGLTKGTSGKRTPPVSRDAPPAANDAAYPTTNDAASPAGDGNPSPQAESPKHPEAGKEQSVDHAPVRLVKEADVCNQEITPSTIRETPGILVIKRCSQGSIKTDPLLSAGSRDSGISLAAGENEEHANVITEKSSPEKQEIAKVIANSKRCDVELILFFQIPGTTAPDLTIQGKFIQPPFRPSQTGKLGATTSRRPSSGLPPLPHPLQRQPPPLQAKEDDKHDKVKLLSIVERPSSRGGMAFDINFDDNNGSKKMPRALQVKLKSANHTKEELQAKLDAAEQRRKV